MHSLFTTPDSAFTVAEFLKKWLAYASVNVSPKSLERYTGIVEQHLIPALGHLPLPSLSPIHIQQQYSDALRNGRKDGRPGGLSPQSVLHLHRVLCRALKVALRWDLITRNPAALVDPPHVPEREPEVIDECGAAKLLQAARGTRLYLPLLIALCTGLRRGEILALEWQDFDSDLARLRVRRAIEETKAGVRFKAPKSRRGRRAIALPALAVEALAERKRTSHTDDQLICGAVDGSIWRPSAFTSSYRDLLKRRGLTGPNFHALRHSHASQLLRAGVDIKTVSERLGHSRAGFTLNTYVHLLPGQDDEAARRINDALTGAIRTIANC